MDIASLCLPLSVSMHLSTHLNLSVPPIHNAHESSQADSQSNQGKMDTSRSKSLKSKKVFHT